MKFHKFKLAVKNQKKLINYMKSWDYWIFQIALLFKVLISLIYPFFYILLIIGTIGLLPYMTFVSEELKIIFLMVWVILILTLFEKMSIMGRFFNDIFKDIK